jgi:excisionase family DNA binding protein
MKEKRFLNKKELAGYLGVSVYTIDSWVSQRQEIPFVKMGRRVMFDLKDIEAWIEKHKTNPVNLGN